MTTTITTNTNWSDRLPNYFDNLCSGPMNLNLCNNYLWIPTPNHPSIKKVIFHDPATIIFWSDGTKTVVKAKNEKFDPEKGLAMAIAKKVYGNKGNYFNEIKKWTEPYYEEKEE